MASSSGPPMGQGEMGMHLRANPEACRPELDSYQTVGPAILLTVWLTGHSIPLTPLDDLIPAKETSQEPPQPQAKPWPLTITPRALGNPSALSNSKIAGPAPPERPAPLWVGH